MLSTGLAHAKKEKGVSLAGHLITFTKSLWNRAEALSESGSYPKVTTGAWKWDLFPHVSTSSFLSWISIHVALRVWAEKNGIYVP